MSRIRSADTGPEMVLRRRLWAEGFRYRLGVRTPGGRPDVTFLGKRVAVFVDGCFWHGCPEHYVRPRTNSTFWARKLRENVTRDRRQTTILEEAGWTVVRVWEHEVQNGLDEVVGRIRALLLGDPHRATQPEFRVVEVISSEDEDAWERRILEDLRDPDVRGWVERARLAAP